MEKTEPADGFEVQQALLKRVRQILGGLVAYWTVLALITLANSDVAVEADAGAAPSIWVTAGVLVLMAALHGVALAWIPSLTRWGWAMTVLTLGVSTIGFCSTPLALWGIYLLFKKPILGTCLGHHKDSRA